MDRNLELKRYAAGFSYFLLKNIKKNDLEHIRSIVLFGSVSRNSAGKDSDIDLFIDTTLPAYRVRTLRSRINKIKEAFLLSNEGLTYKSRGVYSVLNIVMGDLDTWTEMKKSLSSAIVLYGPYRAEFKRKNLQHSMVFFWQAEGKNRGAFLNKLYGYKANGKHYKGSIQRFSGTKIGKSAAIIPAEHLQKFTAILEKYKVSYRMIDVFV